jgi:hypothetical protein
MLEFFVVASQVEKVVREKKKEDKKIKELFGVTAPEGMDMNALSLVAGLIALVISLLTAKLAYECNIKRDQASKVVATLFGFFFSGTYLIYYFIWHTILKNKC